MIFMLGMGNACAQEEGRDPDQSKSPPTSRDLTEVGPKIIYLPGPNGELGPALLGWTLEDFERLLKTDSAHGATPPSATLNTLSISGQVKQIDNREPHAELTVDATFSIHSSGRDEWSRIPLGFSHCALQPDAQLPSVDTSIIEYDDQEGFVLWLKSSQAKHKVQIKLIAPIQRNGPQHRLRLNVPRATTASGLQLSVPKTNLDSHVVGGANLGTPVSTEKTTELNATGLTPDFAILWSQRSDSPWVDGVLFDIHGETLIHVHGRLIQTEATLLAKSFGQSFDRLLVQLPENAELIESDGNGYSITPTDQSLANATDTIHRDGLPTGSWVRVRRDEPSTEPFKFRIRTQRLLGDGMELAPLDLTGFFVASGIRQTGFIAIQVTGDWRLQWKNLKNVRRIETPPESLRVDDLQTAFEYYDQPFALPVQITQPISRIVATPRYEAFIDDDHVRLNATVRFRVSGAPTPEVVIHSKGWTIDPDSLGPDDLVAPVTSQNLTEATARIALARPLSGEFELSFRADRPRVNGSDQISFPLPRLETDSTQDTILAVDSADDLLVSADLEAMPDLRPVSPESFSLVENNLGDAQLYEVSEDIASDETLQFVAQIQKMEQKITLAIASRIRPDRETWRVAQQFDFRVNYKPIDRIELTLPASSEVTKIDSVQINDVPFDYEITSSEDGSEQLLHVRLVRPTLGRIALALSYTFRSGQGGHQNGLVSIPLATPAQQNIEKHNLAIEPNPFWTFEIDDTDEWIPLASEDAPATQSDAPTVYSSIGEGSHVAIYLAPVQAATNANAIVRRGLVHTFISSGSAYTRGQYRLWRSGRRITLTLPEGVAAEHVEVYVDGKITAATVFSENQLTLEFSNQTSKTGDSQVEVRYLQPNVQTRGGATRIGLPSFGPEVPLEQFKWEIVTESRLHLLAIPSEFTANYHLQWSGLTWSRQGMPTPRQLADWIGNAGDSPNRTAGGNRYVLSSINPQTSHTLILADRTNIVLVGAGLVLIVGLAFLYLPAARHPAVLLLGAIGLAAGGLAFPELAIVLANTFILGLILLAVSLGLRYRMQRKHFGNDNTQHATLDAPSTVSTEFSYRPHDVLTHSTTVTREFRADEPLSPTS